MRQPTRCRRVAALAGCLAAVAGGCESLRVAPTPTITQVADTQAQPPSTPKRPGGIHPPLRVSRFVFFADVPLNGDDAVFRELEELPDQIQRELRIPAENALVQVYLFEDQEKYEAFMRDRFPRLPARRAYFIADQRRPGSADDLQVYTWLGEHLRTDLRHELTHALLHGSLKGVPLWLDEGLAGFFEQPPASDGVNADHLAKARKGPFLPDLARLEKITEVQHMEKPEYREAWAWVHFLLRSDPNARGVLLAYLQQLRENPNPGPLLPLLRAAVPDPHQALAAHLVAIGPTARATAGR